MGPEVILFDAAGVHFANVNLDELEEYPGAIEVNGVVYELLDKGDGPRLAAYREQVAHISIACPHCGGELEQRERTRETRIEMSIKADLLEPNEMSLSSRAPTVDERG